MSVLPPESRGVHTVRVYLPDGRHAEIDTPATCGLRMAMRVAGALAGWLAVDDWECASRFRPAGVVRVRRSLLALCPGLDLARCRVAVLCPAEGADALNGYEVVTSYRVGETTPELLRSLREEAKEAGWREDAGRPAKLPNLRLVGSN